MEGTKFTDPELVAMAPNLMKEIASLQSEIDRLQKVSGEDDIKILTLEDHVRNLESEIDRLKEERVELIKALESINNLVQFQSSGYARSVSVLAENILTRIK